MLTYKFIADYYHMKNHVSKGIPPVRVGTTVQKEVVNALVGAAGGPG